VGCGRGHSNQAVFGEGDMFRFGTARVLIEDGILVRFRVVDYDCRGARGFVGSIQYDDLLTG